MRSIIRKGVARRGRKTQLKIQSQSFTIWHIRVILILLELFSVQNLTVGYGQNWQNGRLGNYIKSSCSKADISSYFTFTKSHILFRATKTLEIVELNEGDCLLAKAVLHPTQEKP